MKLVWLGLLGATGCRWGADLCAEPGDVLDEKGEAAVTCAEAEAVIAALTRFTLEPLDSGSRQEVYKEVARRFREDPVATDSWLESMSNVEANGWGHSVEAVERYTTDLYEGLTGSGPFGSTEGALGAILKAEVVTWARDDTERLVLTERAIEGWIRYASLCREVQGGGGLRVSISDRVRIYRDLGDRFEHGTREEQLALAAMGPFWPQLEQAWGAASYQDQQAWIAEAPLPPPMVATSLGYAQQVFEGDVAKHVHVMNVHFGPMNVGLDP